MLCCVRIQHMKSSLTSLLCYTHQISMNTINPIERNFYFSPPRVHCQNPHLHFLVSPKFLCSIRYSSFHHFPEEEVWLSSLNPFLYQDYKDKKHRRNIISKTKVKQMQHFLGLYCWTGNVWGTKTARSHWFFVVAFFSIFVLFSSTNV